MTQVLSWLAFFLYLLFIVPQLSASSTSKAKVLLSQAIEHLPATVDVYARLNHEFQSAWKHDDGKALTDIIEEISHLSVPVIVDVVLIGFDGTGGNGVLLNPEELLRHLKALPTELPSGVIQPIEQILVAAPKISWRARWASAQAEGAVNIALNQALSTATDEVTMSGERLLVLPYEAMDGVISKDYRSPEAYFTIVLINPLPKSSKYIYSYDNAAPPDSHASCGGAHWASEEAYMWVDLGAGPLEYGVGRIGNGHVTQHSLPQVMSSQQGIPGQEHANPRRKGVTLPAELAALLWSASLHFLWPPMAHDEMNTDADSIQVAILQMHDSLMAPGLRVDLKLLQDLLLPLVSPVQNVTVVSVAVSFAECEQCVSAYIGAVRDATVRAVGQRISATSAPVVSSDALHSTLLEIGNQILADRGVYKLSSSRTRVLPVFLFDLSSKESILLDGSHRAVAFPNMVIAAATQASLVVDMGRSGGWCAGEAVEMNPHSLTREIFAALLTAGWAMAPTSAYMTPAKGASVNHLWSVGATPFGPLSHLTLLPAPLANVPLRNLALSAMNTSASRAIAVLEAFDRLAPGSSISGASPSQFHPMIIPRVQLLRYKLSEAAHQLSIGNISLAAAHARSSLHEAEMLEVIALQVNRELDVSLMCGNSDSTWMWMWFMPLGASVTWIAAFYVRGVRANRKHGKQS